MKLRGLALLLALAACGGGGAEPPARTISLRLKGTPPDATVTIDDRIVGSLALVSARGVALPPGQHRISVEARGYLPFDKIVIGPAEGPTQPIPVDVALVPVPD
jgi:hypothetical protein